MRETGGIVAIVAGAVGLIFSGVSTFVGLLLAPVFTSDIGKIQSIGLRGAFAVLICIAIILLGRAAIKTHGPSKENRRMVGGLLIVCAIAAAALLFDLALVILMAQVVIGASMVLLDRGKPRDA